MHSINLIFLFHVCDSLFFNWLHSNLSRTRVCTHTHIHGLLVHPLIPNCLRKRRGEIPLQCLGSALFAGWRRALRSVSPRCAIPSLTHVEAVPSERSVWLNRPFFFFPRALFQEGRAQTERTCEQQELPRSIMGNWTEKFSCLDSDVLYLYSRNSSVI